MKAVNDIAFLSQYWIEAKRISDDIVKNLPNGVIESKGKKLKGNSFLKTVKFSELGNTWSLDNLNGSSEVLKVLADKLQYMIYMGRANDIEPMLKKIISGRTKRLYAHYRKSTEYSSKNKEFIGIGHFRWNFEAHTLNDIELKHLKNFFSL